MLCSATRAAQTAPHGPTTKRSTVRPWHRPPDRSRVPRSEASGAAGPQQQREPVLVRPLLRRGRRGDAAQSMTTRRLDACRHSASKICKRGYNRRSNMRGQGGCSAQVARSPGDRPPRPLPTVRTPILP